MTNRVPYYKIRKGRAYFELGKSRSIRAGMQSSYPLGKPSKTTERAAMELYWEWQDKSGNQTPKDDDPDFRLGTLAHWLHKFKQQEAWSRKGAETIKEWEYCWPTIEAQFGNMLMTDITPLAFESFYYALEKDRGIYVRWRVIKIMRALFEAAVRYDVVDKSPCLTIPNTMPPPRKQIWFASEIATLSIAAKENGYDAMSLAVRLLWETLMSPVDVRTLPVSALKFDLEGFYIETSRAKTGKDVFASLSDELGRDIQAYIEFLGFDLMPSQPILRTVRDKRRYTKVRFTDEFAKIRKLAFGSDEKRQMRDIRRSGNVEADLGGATPDERAEILANTLNKDSSLDATYTPPTVARARKVAEKRKAGRELLAQESVNVMLGIGGGGE